MTKAEILKKCSKKKNTIRINHLWTAFAIGISIVLLLLCVVETAIEGFFAGVLAMWLASIMLLIIIFKNVPDCNRHDAYVVDDDIATSIVSYIDGKINDTTCLKPSAIETCVIDKKDTLMITLILKFNANDIVLQKKTEALVSSELVKIQQRAEKLIPLDLSCVAIKE